MKFFNRIFQKKPRVYLGNIDVVDRTKGATWIEKTFSPEYKDLDTKLTEFLKSIVTLPLASTNVDPKPNDFAIDLLVPNYESGDMGGINLGDIALPLFFRPRSTVRCRLYNLHSLEVVQEVSHTEVMAWPRYISTIFSLKSFVGLSAVTPKNFEYMVGNASLKCLKQVSKAI